jgi:hypothetical protein
MERGFGHNNNYRGTANCANNNVKPCLLLQWSGLCPSSSWQDKFEDPIDHSTHFLGHSSDSLHFTEYPVLRLR